MIFIIPVVVLGLLGLILGVGLAVASKKFAVETDPRVELILGALPGANCGACGFAGCRGCANALVEGRAKPNACPAGGEDVVKKIAEILGMDDVGAEQKIVARIHCGGDTSSNKQKGIYDGVKTCLSASLISCGTVLCNYGCLGFGDCARVCPFNAIKVRDGLPPTIDEEKCTACGVCVRSCPKNLIKPTPKEKAFIVACSSKDKGKVVRQVCDVGCIACGLCVKKCPEKAISLENNFAKFDYTKCKNVGECFSACPTKCIQRRS